MWKCGSEGMYNVIAACFALFGCVVAGQTGGTHSLTPSCACVHSQAYVWVVWGLGTSFVVEVKTCGARNTVRGQLVV
mgnify:CR=1 FL=1